jgi:hypothetical protein
MEKWSTPEVCDFKLDLVRISGPYNQDICIEISPASLKGDAAEREKIMNSILLI